MQNSTLIVPATPAHVPALGALARRTYTDAYGEEMNTHALQAHLEVALTDEAIRRWLATGFVWLARAPEPGGRLLGFVQLGLVEPAYSASVSTCAVCATDAQIHRLYILSTHQNEGLGTRLLQTGLDAFHAHPAATRRQLFIDVWENNHGAQRLYARHGFEKVGAHPERDEQGHIVGHDLVLRLRP